MPTKTNDQITHNVPDSDLKTVLIISNEYGDKGTLITRVDANDNFVFVSLFTYRDENIASQWERCVLVQLGQCPSDLINDDDGECAHNWWEWRLPGHHALACDLDTNDLDAVTGVLMIGMDSDVELSSDLGEVLWDSHQGK